MLSDNAQSLVAKAQAGDQAAFDALIAGHRDGLQNLIRTRLVSSGLQNSVGEDDVYQETLLRAFQKLTAFRWQEEDSFGRCVLNSLNPRSRKRRDSLTAANYCGSPADPARIKSNLQKNLASQIILPRQAGVC